MLVQCGGQITECGEDRFDQFNTSTILLRKLYRNDHLNIHTHIAAHFLKIFFMFGS